MSVRTAAKALEAWMDDDSDLLAALKTFGVMLVAAIALLVALVTPLVWLMERAGNNAQAQCLDSGGAWTQTGTRQGFAMVGKVMVPHTYRVYGCVEVTR